MAALKLNLLIYHTVHLVIIRLFCSINSHLVACFIIKMGKYLFPNDKRGNKSEIQIGGMKGKKSELSFIFTRHLDRDNFV